MNQDQSIRLAELVESLPLSRASVFEVIKALGITTTKGPGPDGRGRVAYLSSADSERLKEAVRWVHTGKLRIADLAVVSKETDPTDGSVDPGSADLHDLVVAAVTKAAAKAAVTTMSDWLDAQMLDCEETENTPQPQQWASPAEPEAQTRFTVDLPRSLHKRLKLAALERDQPMTDLVRLALLEWLKCQESKPEPQQDQTGFGMQQLAGSAVGDGLRMSSWWESRGVPRSTAFRLVKLAGIEPIKRKVRGVRVPVTFLDAGQVAQLDAIVDRLNEGETIAQVEAAWKPIPVPA